MTAPAHVGASHLGSVPLAHPAPLAPAWHPPAPPGAPSAAPDVERALRRAAEPLAPIALAELGGAALMERVDTKFLLPASLAGALLDAVLDGRGGAYRALEVGGARLSRYETLYYDTGDLALYHAHHAGRGTRRKVRRRSYVDSGQHFLEIKLRTGRGRTRKARVALDGTSTGAVDGALDRLGDPALRELAWGLSADALRPVVRVDYRRLTLVRADGAERATLDAGVAIADARGRVASFPHVVVVEVKQPRRDRSPLVDAIRALGVRRGGISKYCLGVASLEPAAKTNRYERLLRHLHRMADRHDAAPHPR